MTIKCILACTEELLLGSIVEDLLTQSDSLDLIEIIGKSQMELLDAVEVNQPQVLVLCDKTHDSIPNDYFDILQKLPELLIVTVSMDDNYMHIYGKQKVLIRQSTDLLSVIQSQ
jgi:hypothetical protein